MRVEAVWTTRWVLSRGVFDAGFAWVLLGTLVSAAAPWALLVILARLAEPAVVGHFALAFSWTSPVFLFTGLQLRSILATDGRREFQFADLHGLRITLTVLGLVAVAGAACTLLPLPLAGVVAGVAAAKAGESSSDLWHGLYQRENRLHWLGASLALRGFLTLLAFTLAFLATRNLAAATGAFAAASWLAWTWDLRKGARLTRLRNEAWFAAGNWRAWRAVLGWAVPLGLAMALISLQTHVPRLLLDGWCGSEALGIFAALAALPVAGTLLMQSLGTSLVSRLAVAHVAGDRQAFRRSTGLLLATAVVLSVAVLGVIATAGGPILEGIYGPGYGRHRVLALWLAAGGSLTWMASALGYAATASRRIRLQPVLFAASLAILTGACWLLIPRFGLPGAGMAVVAGSAASLVLHCFLFLSPSES